MQKKGLFIINRFILCGLLLSTVTKSEQCNLYENKKNKEYISSIALCEQFQKNSQILGKDRIINSYFYDNKHSLLKKSATIIKPSLINKQNIFNQAITQCGSVSLPENTAQIIIKTWSTNLGNDYQRAIINTKRNSNGFTEFTIEKKYRASFMKNGAFIGRNPSAAHTSFRFNQFIDPTIPYGVIGGAITLVSFSDKYSSGLKTSQINIQKHLELKNN